MTIVSGKSHSANAKNAALGGQAASRSMTQEQKTERARSGAVAVASKMTAEQRSERARNAALARFAGKKKAEK